jgi:hypothetical protein
MHGLEGPELILGEPVGETKIKGDDFFRLLLLFLIGGLLRGFLPRGDPGEETVDFLLRKNLGHADPRYWMMNLLK